MSELALHKFVIELLRFTARPGVLYWHCPNGEYRSKRTGAKLKAMGVLPGVADICLVIKSRAYFLELKAAKGVQSSDQVLFAAAAGDAGAPYAIVRTPEGARAALEMWGALRSSVAGSAVRRAA